MAEYLTMGLVSKGEQVRHFVQSRPRGEYGTHCKVLPKIKGDVYLRNILGVDASGLQLIREVNRWNPDLLHFHEADTRFGLRTLWFLSRFRPAVVTLHDFSFFTGGCIYPGECQNYRHGCGGCPLTGTYPFTFPRDFTKQNFRLHEKLSVTGKVKVIAPSAYMKNEARKGALSDCFIHQVANGVDTKKFTSRKRDVGRRTLGLQEAQWALLFISSFNVMHPRKGFSDLARAFSKIAHENPQVVLVIVGQLQEIPFELVPYQDRIQIIGPVNDNDKLAHIYAASDTMVSPTREDNFPCTILESLSTGTPVVSYGVGGIPEMIESGVNGYLAKPKDWKDLTKGIVDVMENRQRYDRGDIRRRATAAYGLGRFIEAHQSIYHEFPNFCKETP